MALYKMGDTVQVADRQQEQADIKSQLYYPHYAGLRGTILKLYGEEASVLIDRQTLSGPVRARHDENERAMRQRWLDGLSEEGRGRLNAREKEFTLNYAILVALKDLQPAASLPPVDPKRSTTKDLTAAEEAFLRERKSRAGASAEAK